MANSDVYENIVLLNLEKEKIEKDIASTLNAQVASLKKQWLEEWETYVSIKFPSVCPEHKDMKWYGKDELMEKIEELEPSKKWFKQVLLEVSLFNPYFALGSFNKRKCRKIKVNKDENSFLDVMFNGKSYYNEKMVHNMLGTYKKEFEKADEVVVFNKDNTLVILLAIFLVSAFSFIVFTSIFGGFSRLSISLSIMCICFGIIGALLMGLLFTYNSVKANRATIEKKAKKRTLKELC